MLIEGNTEDGVESETDDDKKKEEEQPLRVHYENFTLTVKAKKQPLPLVLVKIGEEIGIPVDIQNERLDPIDADISKLPVEDVVRQLSPTSSFTIELTLRVLKNAPCGWSLLNRQRRHRVHEVVCCTLEATRGPKFWLP